MKVKSKRQFNPYAKVIEFNAPGKQLFLWDNDFGIYYKNSYRERYPVRYYNDYRERHPERYYHNSVQWNNIKLLDNE